MNLNDPYITAALRTFASYSEPSPSEVGFRAEELREADRDRAAEARHGGRAITEYLQRFVGGVTPETITLAASFDETVWSYHLSPSGAGDSASRLAHLARGYAAHGSDDPFATDRPVTLPESAFDWPIYRAAMGRLAEAQHADSDALRSLTETENRALHGDR